MALSVNGQIIDDLLIREEAAQIKVSFAEDLAGEDTLARDLRIREWARENVIKKVLLEQSALSDPAPIPAELIENAAKMGSSPENVFAEIGEERRRQPEVRLRMERLVHRIQASAARPNKAEVTSYYRKHQHLFHTPELLHMAHIVKNVDEQTDEKTASDAIAKAYAELLSGRPFKEVADLYSDCPGRGGDLGYHPRGELVDEFEVVAFSLRPGQISEIFRTPFGFHIATVYDLKPAGLRSLAEVKSEIEAMILNERQQEALNAYVAKLRATADIRNVRRSNEAPTTR